MNINIYTRLKTLGFSPATILDVGANVGSWTKQMQQIYPNSRFILFEPNKSCTPFLSEFDHEECLVSENDGEDIFYLNNEHPHHTGNSTFLELTSHFSPDRYSAVKVRTGRLDTLLAKRKIDQVDIIKLDIQGGELLALKGLGKHLRKVEFIQIEVSLVSYNRNSPLFSELNKFLNKSGLVLFDVLDKMNQDGITFQLDLLYCNVYSRFRPLFQTGSKKAKIGSDNIFHVFESTDGHEEAMAYISKRKTEGPFSVIDVGGSANGWSYSLIDAIVDSNEPSAIADKNPFTKAEQIRTESNDGYPAPTFSKPVFRELSLPHSNDGILFFNFDICDAEAWSQVLQYVEKNGKFDFSICSHTLEDVRDPLLVCEMLSRISVSGYIAVPALARELARFEFGENGPRGYIHHRWLFRMSNDRFTAIPKIPIVEFISINPKIFSSTNTQLKLFWDRTPSLKLVNGDYLGPNAGEVLKMYSAFFEVPTD
jgi:FkbM family methyltransferase